MNRPRVLLAEKASFYELFCLRKGNRKVTKAIEAGLPTTRKVIVSHHETLAAREAVREALQALGARITSLRRARQIPDGRYDLVVVVGGDGTVLDVARYVRSTFLLAINSSPSASIGHFCAGSARDAPELLEKALDGALRVVPLTRIRLEVDGVSHPRPALNDVLVAHRVPAATTRYVLRVAHRSEEQKSSGVWVSTAAGSSGAILSAGGHRMELGDRRLQYLVREPFVRSAAASGSYELLKGIVGGEGISFMSRMVHGGLYLDGRRLAVPFGYGSVARLTPDAPPLNLLLGDAR